MCRGRSFCHALGQPGDWSTDAPLPPPQWIRDQLSKLHASIRLAAHGEIDDAREALASISSDEIRDWCVEHGQISGRFRNAVVGVDAPRAQAATGPRTASPSLRKTILERDSSTCRYCGLRVVPREILTAFGEVVGAEHFGTGRANASRHGAALVSWAEVDHVLPFHLGGATTPENLVTSCWVCNYGKHNFTLAQLGVHDPRERAPAASDWDGLWSLLPRLRGRVTRAAAKRPANAAPGRGSATRAGSGGKGRYPDLYAIIEEELASGFPGLAVSNPNPTAWVYFRRLDGRPRRAAIRYRLPDQWAELVLYRATTEESVLLKCHRADPLSGAETAARGRSEVVLWKRTPPVDLEGEPGNQRSAVRGALEVVGELRRWYLRHAEVLAPE